MSSKIFRSIMAVTVAVLLTALFIISGVLNSYYSDMQDDQLRDELNTASSAVESSGVSYLKQISSKTYRFTWISKSGKVLYDTDNDASKMENHKNREEVKEALQKGTGESRRYSNTMLRKTTYYARRLPDQTVLRVSASTITLGATILMMLQPFLFVLTVGMILAVLLAHRLSKRILEPVNHIDLTNPLTSESYDELSPLLKRIDHQNREIHGQVLEIQRRQAEFEQIVKNMKEGLLVVDPSGRILSVNPAALNIFHISGDVKNNNIITVDRSLDLSKALKDAYSSGHSEIQKSLSGRIYQFDISRVCSSGNVLGAVILLFDVTEKAAAEENRREFTANVSHELKTPLQSILGSAELIEGGIVKEEDIPRFAGRIRKEASRMVALINDIIRLSQLDEEKEIDKVPVDLYKEAEEVVGQLQDKALSRHVTLSVSGDSAVMQGVPRLIQEVIFNLVDNSIQYSKPEGGHVEIRTGKNSGGVFLSVKDNGIGIPEDQLDRIFERFYRVDKSHSRRSGGTGLGLSIVKHAVTLHRGKINVTSTLGEGTEMMIRFPEV
ncbi:MAG: ATP-binding protein [Eubacteriales bacterium]|nr:ATP-binding protein [Eubacteriales bacterium]